MVVGTDDSVIARAPAFGSGSCHRFTCVALPNDGQGDRFQPGFEAGVTWRRYLITIGVGRPIVKGWQAMPESRKQRRGDMTVGSAFIAAALG